MLSASLALGIIFLLGLISVAFYNPAFALLLLVFLAPWSRLANVLTGGRLVPLGLDLTLIALTAYVLLPRSVRLRFTPSLPATAALAAVVTASISALGIIRPGGLSVLGGMEGFRAFSLSILGLPLALALARWIPGFPRRLLQVVVAAVLLTSLMGVRQVLWVHAVDLEIIDQSQVSRLPFTVTGTGRLRAFSPLAGPFHFGLLMMFGIVVVTAFGLERLQKWHVLTFIMLIVAFFLNATRLNWLGTAVAMVIVATVGGPRISRIAKVLGAFVMVGGALAWLLSESQSLSSLHQFSATVLDPTTTSSFVLRVVGWQQDILPAIRSEPWLGYGTGMAKDGLGPFTSHNLFLKIQIEGGLILLVSYLVTMATITLALLPIRSRLEARVALALIVGVHAAGMFAPILDAYPGNLYFWLILGAALAANQRVPTAQNLSLRASDTASSPPA